jgi:hypothetical protein
MQLCAVVHCCAGGRDKMAMPQDVAALVAALPDRTLILHHVEPEYQHLDYTWGLDAHQRIYPTVIKVLKEAAANATGSGSSSNGSSGSSSGCGGDDSSCGGNAQKLAAMA